MVEVNIKDLESIREMIRSFADVLSIPHESFLNNNNIHVSLSLKKDGSVSVFYADYAKEIHSRINIYYNNGVEYDASIKRFGREVFSDTPNEEEKELKNKYLNFIIDTIKKVTLEKYNKNEFYREEALKTMRKIVG